MKETIVENRLPKISRSEMSDLIMKEITAPLLSEASARKMANNAACKIYDLLWKKENIL